VIRAGADRVEAADFDRGLELAGAVAAIGRPSGTIRTGADDLRGLCVTGD
jgi:hypothetical protein